MKKNILITALILCASLYSYSQVKIGRDKTIIIESFKKKYNVGDTIILKINNYETSTLYYYTINVQVKIKRKWYYDEMLTNKFNNANDDKMIPLRKLNQGLTGDRFLVDKVFSKKGSWLRLSIKIYKTNSLLDEPKLLLSKRFRNCEATELIRQL